MSKPAYVVVDARSSAPERMGEYRRLAQLAVEKYGGRYLVRGAPYQVLEGDWRPERLVILEFPNVDAARAFHDSPDYAAARAARAGISDFDMLLAEAL